VGSRRPAIKCGHERIGRVAVLVGADIRRLDLYWIFRVLEHVFLSVWRGRSGAMPRRAVDPDRQVLERGCSGSSELIRFTR